MPDTIEFVRLRQAADETPWSERHLYRILTEPGYSHLDPRPKIRRLGGGNYNVLLRAEWEKFKQRLADDGLKTPRRQTKLSKARHAARIEREGEGAQT